MSFFSKIFNKNEELDLTEKNENIANNFYEKIYDNYNVIGIPMSFLSLNLKGYKAILEKLGVKITDEYLLQLIEEIYALSYNCNSISEFNNLLTQKEFKKFAINNLLPIWRLDSEFNYKVLSEFEKKTFNLQIDAMNFTTVDLLTLQKGRTSLIDYYINNQLNDVTISNMVKLLVASSSLIGTILAFAKLLILTNYARDSHSNDELYNIINDFDGDDINKLYNVYCEFYKDTFKDILIIEDFTCVVEFVKCENTNLVKKTIDTLNLLEIDFDKLISERGNHNIYEYILKFTDEPKYKLFFSNEEFRGVTDVIILYYSIDKIPVRDWIMLSLNRADFRDKIRINNEKNMLLARAKMPQEDRLKMSYNSVVTGEDFELFLKELYMRLNFDVKLTPATGDQGADLVIQKNETKTVVQAKFYTNPVGNSAVQEVIGSIKYYNANKGVVITNSVFTKSAIELAHANDIQLIDGPLLNGIIETLI